MLEVTGAYSETLFGKFKLVALRSPKAKLNRPVLAIPTLCGTIRPDQISKELESARPTDLLVWERRNRQGYFDEFHFAFFFWSLAFSVQPKLLFPISEVKSIS